MVNFRFEVDGEGDIDKVLRRIANLAGDPTDVWEEIADDFAANERRMFRESRSDRDWGQVHRPRYARWKARHYGGRPTMVATGRLWRSLTQRPLGVEVISKSELRLGTNVPYAAYHKNRRVVWVSEAVQQRWVDKYRRRFLKAISS